MKHLLLCFALLAADGCTTADDDARRIVAGERIGPVALGDTRTEVEQALGPAPRTWHPPADDRTVLALWGPEQQPDVVVYFKEDRVVQVHVTDATYVTADGFSTGTPVSTIKAHFSPLMTFVNPYEKRTAYYDAVARGIAFVVTYEESDAGLEGTTAAVMVHPPGTEVLIY